MKSMAEKTVRFQQQPQLVLLVEESIPPNDLWYSHSEYKAFRAAFVEGARLVARMNRQSKKGDCSSEQSPCPESKDHPHHANNNPCGNGAILLTFQACLRESHPMDNHFDLQDCLEASNDSVVGLERMAARPIAQDKPRRRKTLANMIAKIQEEYQQRGDLEKTTSTSSSHQVQQDVMIRLVCEQISQPSRLFAQHLAQAVAKAA